MKKEYVKKQLKRLKELAYDPDNDEQTTEITMIFHDVFKFLVERAPTRDHDEKEETDEIL